jgi:hypothetical protein
VFIVKDARWMKNKKDRIELAFNIQACVDYQSKLIVSLNAVQDPTDHNQLIPQIQKVLWAINKYPEKISAVLCIIVEKKSLNS